MSKFDKRIWCVRKEKLFYNDEFQGFMPLNKELLQRIKTSKELIRRGDVEEDPKIKQIISYVLIVTPDNKKAYAYQRATDSRSYSEKRLQGKWSIALGGHVDEEDAKGTEEPWEKAMIRELHEEGGITNPNAELIGFINDNRKEVEAVHLGLLYVVRVNSINHNKEIAKGGFYSLTEIEKMSKDENFEAWSEIALHPLIKIMSGTTPTPKTF